MTSHPLHDRRILIVEDEYYLAMELERELVSIGVDVVGPVPSVEQALATLMAEPGLDGAVLDINLGGDMSFPVADALLSRNVPFVITTGYVDGDLNKRYPHVPRVEKPIDFRKFSGALTSALTE